MNIWVVRSDITDLQVDAIVNAANPWLAGGGGVDGAIHRAAGSKLAEACEHLHGCKPGSAKLTLGYDLPAKYVIHAVGPDCRVVEDPEEATTLLRSTYITCLGIAREHGCKSIAFPAISTGLYRFPMDKAARIAVGVLMDWKSDCPSEVYLVAFTEEMETAYYKALEGR